MNLKQAQEVAGRVLSRMRPYCVRVALAGSVRREVPQVKDIEIVFQPRMVPSSFGREDAVATLFDVADVEGEQLAPATEVMVRDLSSSGFWHLDTKLKRDGERYKRLVCEGVVVELFRASEVNWGYILVLRTGPAEFGHHLVMAQWEGGFLPVDVRVADGLVRRRGVVVPVPSEQEFFAIWGLDYIAPTHRSVGALRMVTGARLPPWRR